MDKALFTEAIAKALYETRMAKNMSQEKLSIKSGISRAYISQIENGGYNLSLYNVAQLAEGLDLALTEFVEVIEKKVIKL